MDRLLEGIKGSQTNPMALAHAIGWSPVPWWIKFTKRVKEGSFLRSIIGVLRVPGQVRASEYDLGKLLVLRVSRSSDRNS